MQVFDFYDFLLTDLTFEPTTQQQDSLGVFSEVLLHQEDPHKVFILQGYAGTGKTSLVQTVISNLWRAHYKYVLLAPTGKAAKVISNYTQKPASTIHRCIYTPKTQPKGEVTFELKKNKASRTVFIVDESSMVSDTVSKQELLFENGNLLADLIDYVYNQKDCFLVFIGDTAQLPPVKSLESPALSSSILCEKYQLEPTLAYLDQVVRQSQQSAILTNATHIRSFIEAMSLENQSKSLKLSCGQGVYRCKTADDVLQQLHQAYDIQGVEQTIVLVQSNKRANQYNTYIRETILQKTKPLEKDDHLMVIRNNYHWLSSTVSSGFIANGDTLKVSQVIGLEHQYGFDFIRLKVSFVDQNDIPPFEALVFSETLTIETAALPYERTTQLYQRLLKYYLRKYPKHECHEKIKQDPYYNALQVKFAYAITCHKSQGGQWHTVFVEQPIKANFQSQDSLRWLYTAVTRAKEQLCFVGFSANSFLS